MAMVENEIEVSIIVPVYNAEKSLKRCVDSILRQTFKNIEVLLIDDGSKDSSGEICDQYAEIDSRVRVIHKDNSGVSDSRNLAIQLARGEYLQFVDSDDWIVLEATDLLLHSARKENCDMVISDFYRVSGERVSHKGDIHEGGLLSREEFAACMMEKPADFYYGVLWNKLYRRDIILENDLHMNPEISWCEDFMFNLEYIRCSKNIFVLKVPIYYYVKTKGSLVSQGNSITKTIQMKMEVFEHYNKFYKEVFKEEDYEKSRLQVYRFLFDAAGDGIVPPTVLPGTYHLGEERIKVSPMFMDADEILADHYIRRKLLEKVLSHVALRYDLQIEDIYVMMCLKKNGSEDWTEAIPDFLNLSKSKITMSMFKLNSKGIVRKKDSSGEKTDEVELSEKAEPILTDIEHAKQEYIRLWNEGLESVRLYLLE